MNAPLHVAKPTDASSSDSRRIKKQSSSSARRQLSRTLIATNNLRAISMTVVQKVRAQENGMPSSELADQLATAAVEQVKASSELVSPKNITAVGKNLRRRLYDALKVLVSIGAITRTDKSKILYWKGATHIIPQRFRMRCDPTSIPPIGTLKKRVASKRGLLRSLKNQITAMERLVRRNKATPHLDVSTRIALPFVLIRTPQTTNIELESTDDLLSLKFHFSEGFQVVNHTSLLDRIFMLGPAMKKPHQALESFCEAGAAPPIATKVENELVADHPLVRAAAMAASASTSPSSLSPPQQQRVNWNIIKDRPGKPPMAPSYEVEESSIGRSPKRRRVNGPAPFPKYSACSGAKPPMSPSSSLLNGPRVLKRSRRRPSDASASPTRGFWADLNGQDGEAERFETFDEYFEQPSSMDSHTVHDVRVRRELSFENVGRFDGPVRSGSGHGKRIYASLSGPSSPGETTRLAKTELEVLGNEQSSLMLHEEDDGILLSPGFSPLSALRSRS